MSCCCGHQPWHYCPGHAHAADYYPREGAYEGRRRSRRGPNNEQFDDYLAEFADELAQVRHEFAELSDKTIER